MGNSKTRNVRIVDCCVTCKFGGGWFSDMQCRHHEAETKPYWLCENFQTVERKELSNEIEIVYDDDTIAFIKRRTEGKGE